MRFVEELVEQQRVWTVGAALDRSAREGHRAAGGLGVG